ncbi:MFS transporter [Aeromonas rivipollensis]
MFGVSSLLAAFAPTPAMLIGARVLLALGGAMIMPCVLGTISRTFEDQDERAMALGLWHANTKSPSQSMIEMGRIDGGGGGI